MSSVARAPDGSTVKMAVIISSSIIFIWFSCDCCGRRGSRVCNLLPVDKQTQTLASVILPAVFVPDDRQVPAMVAYVIFPNFLLLTSYNEIITLKSARSIIQKATQIPRNLQAAQFPEHPDFKFVIANSPRHADFRPGRPCYFRV